MDICVVTYRNDASAIEQSLRPVDRLCVRDNTRDNIGFAAGANAAARQGSGELIVFVNPDGRLGPGALDALEAAFEDESVVAAEASQGEGWDRGKNPAWLSGACLAVRREAFERVGGFDERLFMYAEDLDLSYKLAKLGRLAHVAEAKFDHRVGDRPFRADHRVFRNWLVVERRHHGPRWRQLLRDALGHLRKGNLSQASRRFSALVDYAVRARRWS